MRLFLLSMTIGYLHVGVILLTSRILLPQSVTDWAKSRRDCGVLLCESSIQVPLVQRIRNVNRILALCKERFSMNSLFASNIIYSLPLLYQLVVWSWTSREVTVLSRKRVAIESTFPQLTDS